MEYVEIILDYSFLMVLECIHVYLARLTRNTFQIRNVEKYK